MMDAGIILQMVLFWIAIAMCSSCTPANVRFFPPPVQYRREKRRQYFSFDISLGLDCISYRSRAKKHCRWAPCIWLMVWQHSSWRRTNAEEVSKLLSNGFKAISKRSKENDRLISCALCVINFAPTDGLILNEVRRFFFSFAAKEIPEVFSPFRVRSSWRCPCFSSVLHSTIPERWISTHEYRKIVVASKLTIFSLSLHLTCACSET